MKSIYNEALYIHCYYHFNLTGEFKFLRTKVKSATIAYHFHPKAVSIPVGLHPILHTNRSDEHEAMRLEPTEGSLLESVIRYHDDSMGEGLYVFSQNQQMDRRSPLAYLALLHASSHGICIRFVFLSHNFKFLIFFLGVLVVALVRLDAKTAPCHIAINEHVKTEIGRAHV